MTTNYIDDMGHEIIDMRSTPEENARKLKSFRFPKAIAKLEQTIVNKVLLNGFGIMTGCDKNGIKYYYTIGLYCKYQHPEILMTGSSSHMAEDIFSKAHEIIRRGGSIRPWTSLPQYLTRVNMKSVAIDASYYTEFMGYGVWFYKSLGEARPDTFPAIQFVWQSVGLGIYPWEDVRPWEDQQVLCDSQALAQIVKRNAWVRKIS